MHARRRVYATHSGMWRERPAKGGCEVGDLFTFGDAARFAGIGLNDIHRLGFEQLPGLKSREMIFAAREWNEGALVHLRIVGEIVGCKRLLDPEDTAFFKRR